MITYKHLELSTGHITKRDSEILDSNPRWLVIDSREYGWWIHVPNTPEDLRLIFTDGLEAGISPAFCRLMETAMDHGCRWILLDCDADVDPHLVTFEW